MANDDPAKSEDYLRTAAGPGSPARAVLARIAHPKREQDHNKLTKELLYKVAADPDWNPFVVHWLTSGLAVEATPESLCSAPR